MTMVRDTNIAVQILRQKLIVMMVKYQLGVDMKTPQSDQRGDQRHTSPNQNQNSIICSANGEIHSSQRAVIYETIIIVKTNIRGHPRMELAFLISLSSLFLPTAEMLTTPWKMADATTES